MEQIKLLVKTITKGIQEKKGQDITIVDLQGIDGTIANSKKRANFALQIRRICS